MTSQKPIRGPRCCLIAPAVLALLVCGLGPSALGAQRTFTLTAENTKVEVGAGMTYAASTYSGTVPGPLLRVSQGDQVTIRLVNRTSSAHGIDVAAAQIAPGNFNGAPGAAELSYGFEAKVPGVFAYHCSAIPVLAHVAGGMYGMMIVEPLAGWPTGAAHDITLVQSELYGTPDAHGFIVGDSAKMLEGAPDFVLFNGMVNRYDLEHPIPIKVGELVRVFFLNAGPNRTAAFHVSGAIFSTVYRGGNPANPVHDVPTLGLAPGEGAVFEFRVAAPGDYRFGDEVLTNPYKGAIGIFRATP